MSFKRQRQINVQRLNGLAEPVPAPMKQPAKEIHQQTKQSYWPTESSEVPMTQSRRVEADESVKTLLQPARQAALMKNKKRNESSGWMTQQTEIPPNPQQFNYGSGRVQSFVDDKLDFSAYEMGKKNFQNFVPGDANLPAGAYYDTPAYVDPATGTIIDYDVPTAGGSVEPSQKIKILEVNMGPKQKLSQQPCNNPKCTGCRGK